MKHKVLSVYVEPIKKTYILLGKQCYMYQEMMYTVIICYSGDDVMILCLVAGVKEAIYAQTIAGIFFAFFGGQAMVVLMTTAPLAIYTKSKYMTSHTNMPQIKRFI